MIRYAKKEKIRQKFFIKLALQISLKFEPRKQSEDDVKGFVTKTNILHLHLHTDKSIPETETFLCKLILLCVSCLLFDLKFIHLFRASNIFMSLPVTSKR